MEFQFRGVNEAFHHLVEGFQLRMREDRGRGFCGEIPLERSTSRYGHVWYIQEPVLIHYAEPTHRVLLNKGRDANPFFHLYESLWMLAGRNDVAPLAYYNSRMPEFSDDGKTFNGAYGHRWRHARIGLDDAKYWDNKGSHEYDQLEIIIKHLKNKPESRRAVLSMWNVEDDLLKIDESKDVCCNLNVEFALRKVEGEWFYMAGVHCRHPAKVYLDMTVNNRSNDLVWGLLGANYVQFTMLQEYMAACIGVEVGRYYHFTNNLHAYEKTWVGYSKGIGGHLWLDEYSPADYQAERYWRDCHESVGKKFKLVPLVDDPQRFDQECAAFVEYHDGQRDYFAPNPFDEKVWIEPFLDQVARPMMNAFHMYKARDFVCAMEWANCIQSHDWRTAATEWITKRSHPGDSK